MFKEKAYLIKYNVFNSLEEAEKAEAYDANLKGIETWSDILKNTYGKYLYLICPASDKKHNTVECDPADLVTVSEPKTSPKRKGHTNTSYDTDQWVIAFTDKNPPSFYGLLKAGNVLTTKYETIESYSLESEYRDRIEALGIVIE